MTRVPESWSLKASGLPLASLVAIFSSAAWVGVDMRGPFGPTSHEVGIRLIWLEAISGYGEK